MSEPTNTPKTSDAAREVERKLAAKAAQLLSRCLCESISHMSGEVLTLRSDSLRWSTTTPIGHTSVFCQFAGKTSGVCIIAVDGATAAALMGSAPASPDTPSIGTSPEMADFLREVLNATVQQAIPQLTDAIGTITLLPPIVARDEIRFHDLDGAFMRCEGRAGSLECGCLMDFAQLAIGVDLESANEKLRQMQDRNTSFWVRPENLPGAKFSVVYRPLNEAGGDIYDVFMLPDGRTGYFVGDVAGHDISTGLASASIRALLRLCIVQGIEQTEAMAQLNTILLELFGRTQYATACYAILDRQAGTACVSNMGHPAMLVLSPSAEPRLVKANGVPLGMMPDASFSSVTIPIHSGERIVLFTDGLLESSGKSTWVRNLPRLLGETKRILAAPLAGAAQAICDIVEISPRPYDDIVVLCADV